MASTVSFNNISYYVPVKGCFSKKKKQILFDISGIFKPGMNAIMGPTGSGKTTLLDILAGRIDKSGLEGKVLVDGKKQPKDFNSISGYVVQDDLVMGTLTVEENLKFSADLRVSKSVTNNEREEKVKEVIEELGLTKCSQSKIGTEFIRGVSGGERKRTAIGMELITSPLVLFLDEPTTGLDATTATSVMTTLKRLSVKGNTVIFSIHQPRFAIYRLFDSLMLLSSGKTIYHGVANDALNHFSSIGYECEEHNNPPDFFLDVIIDNEKKRKNEDNLDSFKIKTNKIVYSQQKRYTIKQEIIQTDFHTDFHPDFHTPTNHSNTQGYTNKAFTEREIQPDLPSHFQSSAYNKKLKIELDKMVKGEDSKECDIMRGYKAGFFKQLYIVAKRTLINSWRNPATTLLQFVTTLFIAFLVGILYRDISNNMEESAIINRSGAVFFIIVYTMYASLASLQIFIVEKSIFIHESSAGYYRVSAYFIAKVVCDIIPLKLIPSFIFSLISYFLMGFQMDVAKFFFYFLIIFLVSVASTSFTILFSSFIKSFAVANLIIPLCYVLMMLFSGFLVSLDTIDEWIRWLMYFSIIRYGLVAMVVNEFDGLVIYSNGTKVPPFIVEQQLARLGVELGSAWLMWENVVALICIIIILLIISYVVLRFLPKHK